MCNLNGIAKKPFPISKSMELILQMPYLSLRMKEQSLSLTTILMRTVLSLSARILSVAFSSLSIPGAKHESVSYLPGKQRPKR